VLQKLATSVGTNLGKIPFVVSGWEIWQQDFLAVSTRWFVRPQPWRGADSLTHAWARVINRVATAE
jgi:hypothetical protein